MKYSVHSLSIVAACAGLAHGELVHWSQLTDTHELYEMDPAAAVLTIDISGYASYDFQGDADNEILSFSTGAPGPINAFGFNWDVNLSTVGLSWADEATLTFNDEYSLMPALGDAFSVTNANYQGSLSPELLGSADANGMMHIEFHETGFDDNPDAIDSYFEAESYLYFVFPSPGTLCVAGFGSLVLSRRRRAGGD